MNAGNAVLKRRPIDHLAPALWMLAAALLAFADNSRGSFLVWFWLPLIPIHAWRLVYSLSRAEIEIKGGHLGVRVRKEFLFPCIWPWVGLPLTGVTAIWEARREIAGISAMAAYPTYIFVMSDGRRPEYFPMQKPGKRIDEIREFLNNATALPPVTIRDDLKLGKNGAAGPQTLPE